MSLQPEVDLAKKGRAPESREQASANRPGGPLAKLVTPKGEIVVSTRDLAVPVRIVIDHQRLIPLSGKISEANRIGNPRHNPRVPIFFWFQDTPVGKELYVVLYTALCEWGRCSFCTLPSESSSAPISAEDIYLQILFTFDSLSRSQLAEVRRIFLSNNGSILNPHTMPKHSLVRICEMAHKFCPNLEIVCLETRFETVDPTEIAAFQRWFRRWHSLYKRDGHRQAERPAKLQISAGYETQDPYLRNAILWKGYDERKVQDFFSMCAETYDQNGEPILLDEYVMLKPGAGMTDDEGIAETVETIRHLDRLGKHFNVEVSVRLNPTFAAVGSELYYQFQNHRYTPPTLRDVYQVLHRCHKESVDLQIFLGLNNEGLSYEEGSFGNHDGTDQFYLQALTAFNAHQNFSRLAKDVENIDYYFGDSEKGRLGPPASCRPDA